MSKCLGCKKYRDDDKLRGCVFCNDPGPYCKKCDKCKTCSEYAPGDWTCGEDGNHNLTKDGFKTKCVDCDEFWFCEMCVRKCPCGKGESHYLCIDHYDYHQCSWRSEDDKIRCDELVCREFCSIVDITGEKILFCPKHKPRISESLRDAVIEHIKNNATAEYREMLIDSLTELQYLEKRSQ